MAFPWPLWGVRGCGTFSSPAPLSPATPCLGCPCLAVTSLSLAKEPMVPAVLSGRPCAARPLPLLPAGAGTAALALPCAP